MKNLWLWKVIINLPPNLTLAEAVDLKLKIEELCNLPTVLKAETVDAEE